jgi:hypothetical protein
MGLLWELPVWHAFIFLCSSLQIGRSSESPIDFVVMDTVPGDKPGKIKVVRSTVSRFACRILFDRSNPRVVRIYAAGFDSSRNIVLGVSVTTELYSAAPTCQQWKEGSVQTDPSFFRILKTE